jgi:hypothetical protein
MAIDLTDYSQNANILTNNGATEYTALPFSAKNKLAVALNGLNQYLYAPDSPSLSITGDLTLELLVNLASLPTGGNLMEFAGKWSDAGQSAYRFALLDAGGIPKLEFLYSTDGNYQSANQKSVAWTPSVDTWYHVAVTLTVATATIKFYVNGSQQGTDQVASGTSVFNGTDRFEIGAGKTAYTPGWYLAGRVDEVRLWNCVRTQTQINDNKLLRLANPEAEANLVAYYPFDNGIVGGARMVNFLRAR